MHALRFMSIFFLSFHILCCGTMHFVKIKVKFRIIFTLSCAENLMRKIFYIYFTLVLITLLYLLWLEMIKCVNIVIKVDCLMLNVSVTWYLLRILEMLSIHLTIHCYLDGLSGLCVYKLGFIVREVFHLHLCFSFHLLYPSPLILCRSIRSRAAFGSFVLNNCLRR